jgi:hypothetical protein
MTIQIFLQTATAILQALPTPTPIPTATTTSTIVQLANDPELLDIVGKLIVLVLSGILTYLGQRYVSSSSSQHKMQALGSAVTMAVDRVESLDKDGKFTGLGAVEKGVQKRELGYTIIRESLKRSGWTLGKNEDVGDMLEAAVNAELHHRYGVVLPVKQYGAAAVKALETVLTLQSKGNLNPPEGTDPRRYLVEVAASRLIAELGKEMIAITPENASAWINDALITHELGLSFPTHITQPSAAQLAALVAEAADYLTRLRALGPSSIRLSGADASKDLDTFIITSWLFTEATKRRLNVSTTDIGDAVSAALDAVNARQAGPPIPG